MSYELFFQFVLKYVISLSFLIRAYFFNHHDLLTIHKNQHLMFENISQWFIYIYICSFIHFATNVVRALVYGPLWKFIVKMCVEWREELAWNNHQLKARNLEVERRDGVGEGFWWWSKVKAREGMRNEGTCHVFNVWKKSQGSWLSSRRHHQWSENLALFC